MHPFGIPFHAVGISYKKADISVRGQFNLSRDNQSVLLDKAKERGLHQLVINSTCNRSELYAFTTNPESLIELLCECSNGDKETFSQFGYCFSGERALTHIFHVGSGLDSQILGDFEIIGQLKKGFLRSKAKQLVGANMERLINIVSQASKKIKHTTKLSTGATSVSFAAVQYILQHIEEIATQKVLLFGMGKMGRHTCENLVKHTPSLELVLMNRSVVQPLAFDEKVALSVQSIDQLKEELRTARVLIVASDAYDYTINPSDINSKQPLLILDLSVPSNVHPEVREMKQSTYISLDYLSKITDQTLEDRRQYIPQAQAIVNEAKEEYKEWLSQRKFVPLLKAFKNQLIEEKESEVAYQQKNDTYTDEFVSERVIQKLTGKLAHYLKENPEESDKVAGLIQEVFQLQINQNE